MRMIKAVLFDMDGVLVDTEWFYKPSSRGVYGGEGLPL